MTSPAAIAPRSASLLNALRGLTEEAAALSAEISSAVQGGPEDLSKVEAGLSDLRAQLRMFEQAKAKSYGCLMEKTEKLSPIEIQEIFGELRGEFGQDLLGLAELGLHDQNPHRRHAAVWVLRQFGPEALPAVPALICLFADACRWVQISATCVFQNIGQVAFPALTQALTSPEPLVRSGAARALGAIGSQAASFAPRLTEMLDDPDLGVRAGAIETLGRLGAGAAQAIFALRRKLHEADPEIRYLALKAISDIGTAAIPILPDLIHTLEDSEVRVRTAAARAIGCLARGAKDAVPALNAAFRHFDNDLKAAVISAFSIIGSDPRIDAASIAQSLDQFKGSSLFEAVQILGRQGARARPALPRLEEMAISEPKEYLRTAAAEAVQEIRDDARKHTLWGKVISGIRELKERIRFPRRGSP